MSSQSPSQGNLASKAQGSHSSSFPTTSDACDELGAHGSPAGTDSEVSTALEGQLPDGDDFCRSDSFRTHSQRTLFASVVIVCLLAGAGFLVWRSPQPGGESTAKDQRANRVPLKLRRRMAASVFQLTATFPGPENRDQVTVRHGSCIAVDTSGLFVTSAHTLLPEKLLQSVRIAKGDQSLVARVLSIDKAHDTAFLQVRRYKGKSLPLAPTTARKDTPALVFGFPTKYSGTVFPELKALSGSIEDPRHRHEVLKGKEIKILLIRGTSHFGLSGGAVVDHSGRLLGMSIAARFPSEKSDNPTHVIAIPAKTLSNLLNKLNKIKITPKRTR